MSNGQRICVYPGSFDPVTLGHMDIILRASKLFDRCIVAVAHNPAKSGCFPVDMRMEMLKKACSGIDKVTVASFSGLTIEFCRQVGACAMIRGLRIVSDFESEKSLAQINEQLMPDVETVFLMTRPAHCFVSSSSVRELASFGGDFSAFVPECIVEDVSEFFNKTERGGKMNERT